ncbi:hypothetical protein [Clostridium saccharobutylicum]|uniref:Uncharacterized protein n=1 Tax=Clostridium saccharobutylicum DSM 13864 TaxID=1345695 RepID=U5MUT2_CLOSA|nr:hypothetical protein [Clostridium saccharobutylicum]AGX43212.1 hypothetical protein CLSA_c22350 [Clostridium saccharobutylicum DSM 13864]AQR90511.1 hypothetical protein CLOSC_22300 [Clostridium saccharobutylicum]AQS00417.1 hypothetical protein CSACC_22370 [Clostridium saccharobutylicum]AQS10066.1 hypothetical protein CLOBY_22050 [Clostridium saccharobutylicum]AQS14400.1 hypothetical protein CLOSACC_22370 [Clostridium saccharobutylicum]
MNRAQIDEVKEAIKNIPKKQQENVLLIAKTHGVNRAFLERIKNANSSKENLFEDPIEKYIKLFSKDLD